MSTLTSPDTAEPATAASTPAEESGNRTTPRTAGARRRRRPNRRPRTVTPPKPLAVVLSMALTMVAAMITLQLVNIIVISPLQHGTAQARLYEQLRLTLSEGSAPLGQADYEGKLVTPGTPVALLAMPDLNVREVIVEGTAATQTMDGVGHRRDTPLPGQPGISVLMGRSGAFGGVFRNLHLAGAGTRFTVTTAQGVASYEVIGHRRAGDTAPPLPAATEGRLTLITADGPAFMPNDVLRVDAKLVSKAFDKPAPVILPGSLPDTEQAMGQDTSNLFALVLLLQLLILVSLAAVWSWTRWGKWETWLVFLPVVGATALLTGTQINHLLPNLL
ncbi:sortase [Arthrobacter sp. NPDC056691]|uniref:sortase n=1 Tax=Arthrobacter sp. NPDC056691 TaxID=3345913 RepID=UPI003671C664